MNIENSNVDFFFLFFEWYYERLDDDDDEARSQAKTIAKKKIYINT